MSDFGSWLVYGLCLFAPLVSIFFFRNLDYKSRVLLNLVVFFPTFIFAAARGDVGTDTPMYHDTFNALQPRDGFGLDPLFYFVQIIIKDFGGPFQAFVIFQAFYCWVLYSFGAAKIDRSLPILSVGLLPVLLVDATFNGLRYGMAFATALVIIPLLKKVRPSIGMLLAAIPGMIHSSMLLLLLSTGGGIFFLVLASAGVAANPQLIHVFEYFQYKAGDYSDIARPSVFSGLFPMVQIGFVIAIARLSKFKFTFGINLESLAMALIVVSISIASFSMSALRLIQIGVFLLVIAVSFKIEKENYSKKAEFLVLVLGLLGVVNFLRQIFLVGPAGNVLFVPYVFY